MGAVDICNVALLRVGVTATISDLSADQSLEARLCRQFYEVKRDELLEEFDWGFARRRSTLAQINTTRSDYGYVYALPDDCIAARCLLPGGRRWTPVESWPAFEIEAAEDGNSQVIVTDYGPAAELRYTMRFTVAEKFPPVWKDALSWLLAAELAQPLKKDAALEQANLGRYGMALSRAKRSALTQRQDEPEATPKSIRARG